MTGKLPFEVWPYENQTKMKHAVFKRYFDCWVKMLGKYHNLNYIDCFGGCGAYCDKKGELNYGSPILAAEVIKQNKKDASLLIIEQKKENITNLMKVFEYTKLNDIKCSYVKDDFDSAINHLLDSTSENSQLAPTFFFIDPFGYSIKYSTLKRIMESAKKSEILLNFQYNGLQRFFAYDKVDERKNEIFGSEDWKSFIALKGDDKENAIIGYYRQQLKKIAKYVYPFRLQFPEQDRTYYYLIHLTNNIKGCSIMKSAFASQTHGRVEYLGNRNNQLKFSDLDEIKNDNIESLLIQKYNGQNKSYLEILQDLIDSTPYLESNITKAIKDLERKAVVYIDRNPKATEKIKRVRTSINPTDQVYFNTFPTIQRNTLLYKTKVEYGDFTINHLFGCSHGCNYPCYAMMMSKTYGKIKNYEDWLHPKIVSNALELLDKEIPKYKEQIKFVHLCFSSDPFMYDSVNKRVYPKIQELTLQIIEKLNQNGIRCTILTKGIYPKELIDKKYLPENEYGITLVSLDPKFKKEFEPYSATIDDRILSLENLSKNGLKTWVSIEPYPTPNTIENSTAGKDLDKLLSRISFTNKIIFGKMNYNTTSSRFPNNEEFYKNCVEKVIQFCKEKKIDYYIKSGTPGHEKVDGIFED